MQELFTGLSGTESVFWICAVCGTLFFALRVMLVVVGGFGAEGMDGDFDHGSGGDVHDMDMHGTDVHGAHDTELAFKLISINTVSAFIMMFGWAGLTAYRQYGLGVTLSLLVAFVVGVLTMMLTGYMFVWASKLTSGGADFRIDSIVGQVASVYQRIPAGGTGKIQITVNGMLREFSAQANTEEVLDSFSSVKIVKILGPTVVLVERTNPNREGGA